jgi:hypothetical protein
MKHGIVGRYDGERAMFAGQHLLERFHVWSPRRG